MNFGVAVCAVVEQMPTNQKVSGSTPCPFSSSVPGQDTPCCITAQKLLNGINKLNKYVFLYNK